MEGRFSYRENISELRDELTNSFLYHTQFVEKRGNSKFHLPINNSQETSLSLAEYYICSDDVRSILRLTSACLEKDDDSSEQALADIQAILCDTKEMLMLEDQNNVMENIDEYNRKISDLKIRYQDAQREDKKQWDAIFAVMARFADKNYLQCIIANRKFQLDVEALDGFFTGDIKKTGQEILKKACAHYRHSSNKPSQQAPLTKMFTNCHLIQNNKMLLADFNQYVEKEVPLSLSLELCAGYLLKAFAVALAAASLVLAAAGIWFAKETIGASLLLTAVGIVGAWASYKFLKIGGACVATGQQKSLYGKLSLFGLQNENYIRQQGIDSPRGTTEIERWSRSYEDRRAEYGGGHPKRD